MSKIVSPSEIQIYSFSESVVKTNGREGKPVLNHGSIEKKINNIEDAIYYLKTFSEVLNRVFNKQKNRTNISLAEYDALMVLIRDLDAAIVNAYNNKEGNL